MIYRLFMLSKIIANVWDSEKEFVILDLKRTKFFENETTGEVFFKGKKEDFKFLNEELKSMTEFKEEIKWSNSWGAKPAKPFLA